MKFFNKIFKSYSSKVVLLTTLLLIGILGVQSAIYIDLETKTLENTLISSKKEFAELLAMNLGAAQSLGGFAFQSQLIDEGSKTKDTIFVRFVKPDGEIYLSNIRSERGEYINDPVIKTTDTVIRDETFNNEKIKIVISPGSAGYSAWLGFSLKSIHASINETIFSRILIAICILILGIVLSQLLADRVTHDIIELKTTVEKIGKGNLNIKAKITSEDEIGELGKQFNRMTQKLGQSQKKIQNEKMKLEALLTGIGEAVIALDNKGKIMVLNKKAENMFETKLEDCYGKLAEEIFYFTDNDGKRITLNDPLLSEVKKKKKTVVGKYLFQPKRGKPFPVSAIISPIYYQGKIIGIVGALMDITKEEQIDKAKTEFIYLASHQLQTPLTAIKWFLEILLTKEKLSRKQRGYVKRAKESNERMINLVKDFLNVSRLEEGAISVNPITTDIVGFIKELIGEAQIIAKRKSQHIKLKTSHKVIICSFDPNLITQIIFNLLSNAIHYSDTRERIMVSVKKKSKQIEIVVSDKGIGIPEADQKMIFTKFFRTGKSKTISTTGSGLGLYTIKKILDACNGKIKCDSKIGKGSNFTVTLPLKGPAVSGEKKLIESSINEPL